MATASGFSIITGMWRWAQASTTMAWSNVLVKVATASGFTLSSMAARSPGWNRPAARLVCPAEPAMERLSWIGVI